MFNGLCHTGAGNWGSVGNFGVWGWIGLVLNLIFWVASIAGLALLAIQAMRRARVPVAARQPNATEFLQAQYARGEITREEYERRKHDTG